MKLNFSVFHCEQCKKFHTPNFDCSYLLEKQAVTRQISQGSLVVNQHVTCEGCKHKFHPFAMYDDFFCYDCVDERSGASTFNSSVQKYVYCEVCDDETKYQKEGNNLTCCLCGSAMYVYYV